MNLTKENIHEVYQNVLELVKLGKSTNSILASLGLERNKFIHLLNKEQKRELRDERVVFAHKYRVEQYWDGTLEEIGGGFGGCGGSTYTIPKLQPFEAPRDIRLKQDALAISWMGRPESKKIKEKNGNTRIKKVVLKSRPKNKKDKPKKIKNCPEIVDLVSSFKKNQLRNNDLVLEDLSIKEPFNPFDVKIVNRPYTRDLIKADIGEISEHESMKDIPEPTYSVKESFISNITSEYFNTPISYIYKPKN